MLYSGPAGREFCSERRTVSYSVVSAEGSTPQLNRFLIFLNRLSCTAVGANEGAELDFGVPIGAFQGFYDAIGAHVFNRLQLLT
jgi:hypothetical protein